MQAVVYKIDNCNFCQEAVASLENANMQVTEMHLSLEMNVKMFKQDCPGATTVPQIFIEGKYIGGYEELKQIDLRQMYIDWCLDK